ncbi:MAG: hypothetical protein JNL60_17905 [Bacteroidia bacterium]|nr:hypothetical protein [Bacteroidia bacterium]
MILLKKLTLITGLLFSAILSMAQVKFSLSKEFETVRKHQDIGFYRWDTSVYAQVYYRPREELVFQTFDERFMKMKKEKAVKIKAEDGRNEGLFTMKENHYWLYSTWKRDEEKEELWAHQMDRTTFKFIDKPIKLIESGKLASEMGWDKYRFYRSADNSYLLMTCRLRPKEKRDRLNKDVIGYYLYNGQMKTVYAHQIEMPYTEAEMDILGKDVDSKGNIFVLASVLLNNALDGISDEKKRARRYELMRVNQKNNTMEGIKIELDGKYLKDVVFSEDLIGNMIITGYYSNQATGGVEGAYVFRIELNDKNGVQKINKTYCEFPKEILQAYESDRTKRKIEKKSKKGRNVGASALEFRKVVFGADGSLTIIGEEHYVVAHTSSTPNGGSSTSYTYYYENIYVLRAGKDGKTQWCKKIPKYQKGKRTYDLGFYSHSYKGNNYFFFIDNKKNIDLPESEKPAQHLSGKGGVLTCVKIDPNGKMTKEIVLDTREEHLKLSPQSFEYVGENIIVDRLKKSRKQSVVFKLELN